MTRFSGWGILYPIDGCIAFMLALGCGAANQVNGGKPAIRWMSDATKVERALPILDEITVCAWCAGIYEDNSRGLVPGPSTVFLRGYALISEDNAARLLEKYQWSSSDALSPGIELPDNAPRPAAGEPLLESNELNRGLIEISAYHEGKVLFQPERRIVYFDLLKG